jgi:hypothetical protein
MFFKKTFEKLYVNFLRRKKQELKLKTENLMGI